MKLTPEERKMIDDNSTRLVRRIVEAETPLAYLVYKIAAADIHTWTPQAWQRLLDELKADPRKLHEWAEAQLAAANEDREPYAGDPDLGYQY